MVSTVSFAQAGPPVIQGNTTAGRLSPAEYDSVKALLKQYSQLPLRDTVILKYQYDVMPAGNIPHNMNDEIIQQNVTGELKKLHSAMARRKNISVFNFVAPGLAGDTVVMNNNLAIMEYTGILKRLFLKGKNATGSIILTPGRQYICFMAAEGWEALDITGAQVQQLLTGDLAKMN